MSYLKKLLSVFVTTAIVSVSFAVAPLPANAQAQEDVYMSLPIDVAAGFTSIGVNWDKKVVSEDRYTLHLRFLQAGQWTPWYYVTAHNDYNTDNADQASAFFATNYSTSYQYMLSDLSGRQVLGDLINHIEFQPIHQKPVNNYRLDELVSAVKTDIDNYPLVAATSSSPSVISRKSWGADESLRVYTSDPEAEEGEADNTVSEDYQNFLNTYADELKIVDEIETNEKGQPLIWPQEYPEKIRKIFIHHTATTKNLDNPRQAIRDIYYWHTVSRGWGDIGYNYIIDPDGNVYEGRAGGEGVIGAHTARANNGSIGIAILGNFEDSEIPTASFNSLVDLVRAKTTEHNIDPIGNTRFRGKMMPNINGHRDFSATACPGKNLYAQLPLIRSLVSSDVTSVSADAEAHDYRVISKPKDRIPALQKATFEFDLKLKNTGSETWVQGGKNRIAIIDQQNRVIATLADPEVIPGATGTFHVRALSPEAIGDVSFKVKPIIGEDTTFDNAWITVPLNVFAEPYKGELVALTDDRVFRPGEVKNIWIKFRNDGSEVWDTYGSNGFQFTYLAPTEVKILRGNIFEEQIAFGDEGIILVTISAPLNEGEFMLYFQPWVNGHGITDYRIEFPITVSQDPNAIAPPAPQVEKILKSLDSAGPKETPKNIQSTSVENKPTEDTSDSTDELKTTEEKASTYQDDSTSIRVALSFPGDQVITGDAPFEVYKDDHKIAAFSAGDKVKVVKESADYQIIHGTDQYFTNLPPRFEPGLQTILSIDNFENRPGWNQDLNDNSYRGSLEVREEGNGLIVINELPLETYLRGLAEVSNTAHPEKIKSIIVAARTYAQYYLTVDEKFPGKPYDLDDSPERSQKYRGYGLEKRSPKIAAAVRDTTGEVVTYDGKLVKTPYFNQSDGHTRSAQEVWGWTTTPYLQSVEDKYCDETELLGHGVGLSGCGATGMAESGFDYQEILKYFYQGVAIEKK